MSSICAPLAQLVERWSHNPEVVSSILTGRNIPFPPKFLYVHLSTIGIWDSQLILNTYHSYNITLSLQL